MRSSCLPERAACAAWGRWQISSTRRSLQPQTQLCPRVLLAADLAGAQYVWARWFQPLISQYEPLVDRRLAESKAMAGDWLHSNAMRLLALAQAKAVSVRSRMPKLVT